MLPGSHPGLGNPKFSAHPAQSRFLLVQAEGHLLELLFTEAETAVDLMTHCLA